jgi:hypothetical protein
MVSGGFENRQPVHSQIQPPAGAGLSHLLRAIDQTPISLSLASPDAEE